MTRTGSRPLGRDDVVPTQPVVRTAPVRSAPAVATAARAAAAGPAGGANGADVRVPAPTVADLTSLGALLLFDRRPVRTVAPTTAARGRPRTPSG